MRTVCACVRVCVRACVRACLRLFVLGLHYISCLGTHTEIATHLCVTKSKVTHHITIR